jgi:hypothetical protein
MLSRALSTWGRWIGLGRNTAPAETERRVWARFPVSIETTCCPANEVGGERLTARVQNISCGGVSLLVQRAFAPGDLLSLDLPAGGPAGACTVLACVVRAEAGADGQWALGCTFSAELSDEDLQRFGARRARAAGSDQRTWVRFACRAHASFQTVLRPQPEARPAQVMNISASGVALQVAAPLSVGELLSIELRGADDRVVLTTLASVVRVAVRNEHERVAGCNFIHELSEKALRALL